MTFTASWTLDEAKARALTDALAEADTLAADMTETSPGAWTVIAYFEFAPDEAALSHLGRTALGRAAVPTIEELPDEDWVTKSLRALAPVRAGRCLVHGAHDRAARRANDIAIEIDANQAFGTGHHGTTAGCLAALSHLAKRRRFHAALDLGTGSGVLAIAAAKLWHIPVVATDIDPIALAIAANNIRLNGVARHIRTLVADGVRHPLIREAGPFDLVIANILAGPLAKLAPAIAASMTIGGVAILSGLLPTQRRWIQAAYRKQGLIIRRASVREGWLTLVLERTG